MPDHATLDRAGRVNFKKKFFEKTNVILALTAKKFFEKTNFLEFYKTFFKLRELFFY